MRYPKAFDELRLCELEEFKTGLRSSVLTPYFDAFDAQIGRIHTLLDWPIRMYYLGQMWHDCRIRANVEVLQKIDLTPEEVEIHKRDLASAQQSIFNEQKKLTSNAENSREVLRYGAYQVDAFGSEIPGLSEGSLATLSVAILESWSSYEILVNDLWYEVINCQPSGTKKKLNSFETMERDYQPGFLLNKNEDLSKYNRLLWLYAFRNVLSHRGGKVDQKFLDRVVDHPLYKQYQIDDKVHIDGTIVAECINAAISAGIHLLNHVDEWLIANHR